MTNPIATVVQAVSILGSSTLLAGLSTAAALIFVHVG